MQYSSLGAVGKPPGLQLRIGQRRAVLVEVPEGRQGSCRAEPEPGVISECSECYDMEANAQLTCGHLAIAPPQFLWSSDPCPRTEFVGVCLFEATLRAHYYYDGTTLSRPLSEDCELKGGWFYEP